LLRCGTTFPAVCRVDGRAPEASNKHGAAVFRCSTANMHALSAPDAKFLTGMSTPTELPIARSKTMKSDAAQDGAGRKFRVAAPGPCDRTLRDEQKMAFSPELRSSKRRRR